jgi:hypothetical protein
MSEDRVLGPEMIAERWYPIGSGFLWAHEPSHRCVTVSESYGRKTANYDSMGVPALHGEPADPSTTGWIVSCTVRDEGGCPIEGSSFWVESYGEAIRRARAIRQTILDGRRAPSFAQQLTLDDVLSAKEPNR